MERARGWTAVLRTFAAEMRGRPARPAGSVTVAAIAGLFVAVTVLRWFIDGSGQAAALLYVVPIALSGLWYGRRAGIGAAAVGVVAFAVLALVHGHGDLDLTGWAGPILAMAIVGALVGHLAERAGNREQSATRRASQDRRLAEICEAQQAALEASDSIVQEVAAARWMLQVGRTAEAMDVLGQTVADGISRLSEALALDPTADGKAGAAASGPRSGLEGLDRGDGGSLSFS